MTRLKLSLGKNLGHASVIYLSAWVFNCISFASKLAYGVYKSTSLIYAGKAIISGVVTQTESTPAVATN